MAALLLCCSGPATAGIDDVWAASPATRDTAWAQQNAAPVKPGNSGNGPIFTEVISGECSPNKNSELTCVIADLTWFCTLRGVGGAGDEEYGEVRRTATRWEAYTRRSGWPARYLWACFK